MRRASLIALAALGCGHPASPQPPPGDSHATAHAPAPTPDAAPAPSPDGPLDRDLPRLAERAVALYKDVLTALTAAGDDCAAATAKLAGLRTTYADVTAANAKVLHDGRARELRAALEPHAAELEASAKAIADSPTLHKCSSDPAFTDAFDAAVGAPP